MIEFILAGFSMILGGLGNNIIGGGANTIISGSGNSVTGSYHSTIGGGVGNTIQYVSGAFVGIGGDNYVAVRKDDCGENDYPYADFSSIGGGYGNMILAACNSNNSSIFDAYNSFLGGGQNNGVIGSFSFLGGGSDNSIGGHYNTIAGGQYNAIITQNAQGDGSNYGSTILGGSGNAISSSTSASIPGGYANIVSGASYSFAGGIHAHALHKHSFVWNTTGVFATTKPGTFIINAYSGVGIQTDSIATGVDLEINQVFRLKPRATKPFVCSGEYDGSVFIYKAAGETTAIYPCFCGRGYHETSAYLGEYKRRKLYDDTSVDGSCGEVAS